MSASPPKRHEVGAGDANARNILEKLHMQEERRKAVGKSVAEQAEFNRKQSMELKQFQSELAAKANRFAALHADEVQEKPPEHDPVVVPPKPKVKDSHVWKNATGDGFARYYLEKKAAKLEAEKRDKEGAHKQAQFNRRKSVERQGFEEELRTYRLKKLQTAVATIPEAPTAPAGSGGAAGVGEEEDASSALKNQIIAAAMKKLGKKRALPEPKLGIELGHVLGVVDTPTHIRADLPVEQGNTTTTTHASAAPTRDYTSLSSRQMSASGSLERVRGPDVDSAPHHTHTHSYSLDVRTPSSLPRDRDRSPARGPASDLPVRGSSVMSTPLPDIPAVPNAASVQRHKEDLDEIEHLLATMTPDELAELLAISSGPDPHEAAIIAKLEACPEFSPERSGAADRASASAPSSAKSSPQVPRRTFSPPPTSTSTPPPPPPPPAPPLGSLSAPPSSSALSVSASASNVSGNTGVTSRGISVGSPAGSVSGPGSSASLPTLVSRASNISIAVSDPTPSAPANTSSSTSGGGLSSATHLSSPLARNQSTSPTLHTDGGPASNSSRTSPSLLPETRERRALSDASLSRAASIPTSATAPLTPAPAPAPAPISPSTARSPASAAPVAAAAKGSLSWPTPGATFTRPPTAPLSPETARRQANGTAAPSTSSLASSSSSNVNPAPAPAPTLTPAPAPAPAPAPVSVSPAPLSSGSANRPERPAPTGTAHVASAPDSPDTKRSSKLVDPRTTTSLSGTTATVEGGSPAVARRILAMAVDTEADRIAAAEREERRREREERRAAILKAAAAKP